MQNEKIKVAAARFLHKQWNDFSEFEKRVVKKVAEKHVHCPRPEVDLR